MEKIGIIFIAVCFLIGLLFYVFFQLFFFFISKREWKNKKYTFKIEKTRNDYFIVVTAKNAPLFFYGFSVKDALEKKYIEKIDVLHVLLIFYFNNQTVNNFILARKLQKT